MGDPIMNVRFTETEQAIAAELHESIEAKRATLDRELPVLARIAEMVVEALAAGGKVLVFGNGGSAADSQHIAAELVSRFRRERGALAAIALTTDTSILTAIGNDYGFEDVFVRQVEALGRPGDVVLAISTSGNSPNVLKAVRRAAELDLRTVGFTGDDGGKLRQCVDLCFRVPSFATPHIQEVHIAAGHAVCEVVESRFAGRS
jgi:D-sedoheptulose 7-phosphate isomerase